MINGTDLAVSDYSYFPVAKVGSCGWIIPSLDGNKCIKCGSISHDTEYDQGSCCSELGGQLVLASVLKSIR